ncbi:MAG: flavodoxin-dependent (E)-4-hydroxy-3-methylbut-2-enyl-diphosphate synthase, partial [Clostridia bacterium]|nr:flavodoxin-dependent (E)-4-hydroxy-3-methylbut-2-enyl-diphosphate synthase [Clostridia bacterium]
LAESARRSVRALEKEGFYDIVVSVKSSDVRKCVEAYEELDKVCDYPLHVGITESGAGEEAIIKSTAGIGALLLRGIGDTIRVSLTGNPVREVEVGKSILRAIGKDNDYVEVVSCPTCARCYYDLENLVNKCKDLTKSARKKLKIAVMGCVVNGPGEASDADIGIAGGKDKAVLFKKGEIIGTMPLADAEIVFLDMLKDLIG